jgi:isochorismate synthase
LADTLLYRKPGLETVKESGYFKILDNLKDADGFIITSFLKDKIFQFVPISNLKLDLFHAKSRPFCITEKEYLQSCESFMKSFEMFDIQKAILSRIKSVSFDETKSFQLFDALCEAYPAAFVYLVSSKEFGTWVGATPETLLEVHRKCGFTMALAGTKSNEQLNVSWGEKEKQEQLFVTHFIQDKLERLKIQSLELVGPYDFQAGPVMHLRTDFSFDIEHLSPIEIAKLLHPTPAVSGFPQNKAVDLIDIKEAHEREFYAGMIGFVDQHSASLYVNLRCCQIQKGVSFLYVGGGITLDSLPQSEWDETELKSKTLIDIMRKTI